MITGLGTLIFCPFRFGRFNGSSLVLHPLVVRKGQCVKVNSRICVRSRAQLSYMPLANTQRPRLMVKGKYILNGFGRVCTARNIIVRSGILATSHMCVTSGRRSCRGISVTIVRRPVGRATGIEVNRKS